MKDTMVNPVDEIKPRLKEGRTVFILEKTSPS